MIDRLPIRYVLMGAVGIVLGGVASRALQPPEPPQQPVLAGRPECQHEWPFKHSQMEEIGSNLHVPEFNDCQRFIEEQTGRSVYGALYAIFAAERLARIQDSAGMPGGPERMGNYVPPEGLVVAKIYAEGHYGYLGIQPPMNCLVVFADGESLRAKMIPLGSVDSTCSSVDALSAPGKWLQVHEQRGHFRAEDYPPVARWEWDDATQKQYLGFGCAAAWCEVGDDDLQPSQPVVGGVPTRAIKGWYDEQLLAFFPRPDSLAPSPVRGTIYPLHDSLRLNGQYAGRWVPVAHVALGELPGADPRIVAMVATQYKERFNYDLTAPGGELNTIYLCQGWRRVGGDPPAPGALLPGAGGSPPTCRMQPVHDMGGPTIAAPGWVAARRHRMAECTTDGNWWAAVDPAGDGLVEYYCITRRDPGNVFSHVRANARRIPVTARWRWMALDEGTWSECAAGCCEKLGL